MKRRSLGLVLLPAAFALLLPGQIALSKSSDATAATSSPSSAVSEKQKKTDANINQQLKDLVKQRRTTKGWLGDGTVPDSVRTIKDISYVEKGSSAQKLDLYIPSVHAMAADDTENFSKSNSNFAEKRQNLSKGWPIVVWIHGGGWRSGDKKAGPIRALLEAGFAVASVNYRLSDEAKWPAQLDDCRSALNFIRAHASEYDIDPKNIGLWGASAGGQLALMMGLKHEKADDGGDVSAICDWFGPTDLGGFVRVGETTSLGIEMIKQLFGIEGDALLAACKQASPITYVEKGQKCPPLLIMHGKGDELVSIRQSQRLVQEMKSAGMKNVKLVELNGGHGFPGFGENTVDDVIAFFKSNLDRADKQEKVEKSEKSEKPKKSEKSEKSEKL